MRKHVTVTLCFTCTAGAFGVLFRWLQLRTAFEAETGLPIAGAWTNTVVIALSLFMAALLLFLTAFSAKKRTGGSTAAKLPAESVVFSVVSLIACISAAAGAVLLFFSASNSFEPSVTRAFSVLALAAGISFPAFVSSSKQSSGFFTCLLALIPVIFCSYWLIVSYRDHAANPVIWEFAFEILAISASILGFFFVAGYPCGTPKPLASFYFCNLAAFLCIITLVDARPFAQSLILFSLALVELLYAGGSLADY
ncbi:MAG: hypothetical protein FWG32_04305 [Oscillospiraceae bacterium]|nr:hypothetical protein [Oscillospiraceae bacterium]